MPFMLSGSKYGTDSSTTSFTALTGSLASPTLIDFTQVSTPANPAASHTRLYFKSDNNLYKLTSSGAESLIGATGITFANAHSGAFAGSSSSYIDCGNPSNLNFNWNGNPVSLSVWFKWDGTGTDPVLINNTDPAAGYRGYELQIGSTNPHLTLYVQGSGAGYLQVRTPNSSISANTWTHVVVTSSDGTAANTKIYINGVSATLTTDHDNLATSTASSHNVFIGLDFTSSGHPFSGKIDEVAFFNAALSAGNVTSLYKSRVATNVGSILATNLVSWYRFENTGFPVDTSSLIYDRVGTNDATNNNVTFSTDVVTADSTTGGTTPTALVTWDSSDGKTQDNSKLRWNDSTQYLSVSSGLIGFGSSLQQVVTFPDNTTSPIQETITIHSSGTTDPQQHGISLTLNPYLDSTNYTGSGFIVGAGFSVYSQSTGNNLWSGAGNVGVAAETGGVCSGANVGLWSDAKGSSALNLGVLAVAGVTDRAVSATATNVGIAAFAPYTLGNVILPGFFSLADVNHNGATTFPSVSAVLSADNGASGFDICRFYNNGSLVSKLSATGVLTVNGGIVGTATNDSASAGNVGEVALQSRLKSAATSVTSATPLNITTTALSLTAGDWDLEGIVSFLTAAGTSVTEVNGAFSKTSATLPASDTTSVPTSGEILIVQDFAATIPGTSATVTVQIPRTRVSVSTTSTIYLVGQATFSVSTMTAYGSVSARRVR